MSNLFNQPIFIGGTGHSGTRAFVNVVEAMGVWFEHGGGTRDSEIFRGVERDDAGKHMGSQADRYLREWYAGGASNATRAFPVTHAFLEHAAAKCEKLAGDCPQWGAKLPRFLFVVPLLHNVMKGNWKFIHVVRHVLRFPNPNLWAKANGLAASFGLSHMDGQYMRVRYEDLCESPVSTLAMIKGFVNPTMDLNLDDIAAKVKPSKNTYEAYDTPEALLAQGLSEYVVGQMARFGYIDRKHTLEVLSA